jgi:hypothetical protein
MRYETAFLHGGETDDFTGEDHALPAETRNEYFFPHPVSLPDP